MYISQVKIKGFRNFKEDIINFKENTLIIGQNDIGKSNLIYALRILLDKNISEADLEPKASDFYAFEEINEFYIQIKFESVKEQCILAKFKGNISENEELYLSFKAIKDLEDNSITYYFSQGKDEESLLKEENKFETRFYLRTLNMEYVKSNRNLQTFIKKEKKNLLLEKKKERSDDDKNFDNETIEKVKEQLNNVNNSVRGLSYIKNATNIINENLQELSTHNKDQIFQFSTITESIEEIQDNVELVSKVNDKELCIGGDGRNNQIFMSLWCNKYNNSSDECSRVTIYCIEEPEAHLHPHQQRQLSKFLLKLLKGQVIISSHSPQIAAEFEPSSIIRLYKTNYSSTSANNGCSKGVADAIDSFGYRMNIIASEAFFSRVVLLVEGPSEEIFYKTLAYELNLELDKHGISIVDVNGVGFAEYIKLLRALNIKFVFRTDNDIFKIQNKEEYRCAGAQRIIDFYENYYNREPEIESILENKELLNNLPNKSLTEEVKNLIDNLRVKFNRIGIFLSEVDLENDIYDSGIAEELSKFYGTTGKEETVSKMKNKKAINLYEFLKKNEGVLKKVENSSIVEPLKKCIEMSEENE